MPPVLAALVSHGALLAGAPLSSFLISFAFYGFIGWVFESTVCSLANRGHFTNSGFLLGPCCPIYGVGAMLCWLLLRRVPGTAELFLASAVLCCTVEYLVACLLESTTHARFWDYSRFPLNIQGRVCLYGALVFGSGAVLICRVVQPWLLGTLSLFRPGAVIAAALVIAVLLAVDTASSIASWRRLSSVLDGLRADLAARIDITLKDASDSLIDLLPESAVDSATATRVRTRAINAWLADISDALLEALRSKVEVPSFMPDGADGLRLAARRLAGAIPGQKDAGKADGRSHEPEDGAEGLPKFRLRRRELRFFNAFPSLKMMPYEGIIRATKLRDRARELFGRK